MLAVFISTFLALLASLLPLPSWLELARPPCLPLVLIYWTLALPKRMPLAVVWCLGLLLDALYNCLLGRHALALTVIIYLAYRSHRQVHLWPLIQQACFVALLILLYQILLIGSQDMGRKLATLYLWLPPMTSLLLWPLLAGLLQMNKAVSS